MARYLLSTQALLDIALLNNRDAHRWFVTQSPQDGVFVDNVAISAFSVAAIRAHFAANPPRKARDRTHQQNVMALIGQFKVINAIEGATPDVVEAWEQLAGLDLVYDLPDGGKLPLGFEEKFVLATARKGNHGRGFTLVDRACGVHADLGIPVIDPYKSA